MNGDRYRSFYSDKFTVTARENDLSTLEILEKRSINCFTKKLHVIAREAEGPADRRCTRPIIYLDTFSLLHNDYY